MMAKFYTEQQVRDYFKKVKKYILDKGLVTACDIFPEELRIDAEPIEMFVLAEVKKDTEVIVPFEHTLNVTFPAPTEEQTYNTLNKMLDNSRFAMPGVLTISRAEFDKLPPFGFDEKGRKFTKRKLEGKYGEVDALDVMTSETTGVYYEVNN